MTKLINAGTTLENLRALDNYPKTYELIGYITEWINRQPAVDAIPVEWLKAQISPYTGDVSDIGKSVANGTIKGLIRKWQKEQEVGDKEQ